MKLTVRIVLLIVGVGVIANLSYQYGQRRHYEDYEVHLNDQLSRINTTTNMLMDLSMRNYHYQAHKDHKNPWCPECYDLLRKYKQQVEEPLIHEKIYLESQPTAGE